METEALPFPEPDPEHGGPWRSVARVDELAEGQAICVTVGEERIGLFHVGGNFYAIGNDCTHVGAPLHEGWIDGMVVHCPLHDAGFELSSGRALDPPAPFDVPTYAVRVADGQVWVGPRR